jgi:tetratricopeptide (TPR) repeat protein
MLEKQAPSEKAAIGAIALAALNHAASQKPSSSQLRLRLADDYNALGAVTNAAQIYLQLIDEFGDLPAARSDVREKLAIMYLSAGEHEKAAEQLQAIVVDDPTNWRTYARLGDLLEDQNKLAEAVEYYQKTLLLNDELNAPFYYHLAQLQIDLNQPQQALDTLTKAARKFRPEYASEVLTAFACEKQKDYASAVSHFTAAEVIAKTSEPERLNGSLGGSFYFDQGAAYERAGNFEEAERSFEKSISLAPNFPVALNYLGYMLADRGVQLEKARDLIEKALKLEPKNPAYLDSMGWVLYKLNRSPEALPQLQKAIALSDEPDPTLYDHLGDIYAALKDTARAREAWKKSLGLEASEQVRKKLDESGGMTAPETAH